jgi:TonB family protein
MRHPLFLFSHSIIVLGLVAACWAQSSEIWLPSKILGIVYPRLARFSRVEGEVKAKCLIKEDGSVATVEILSSPHNWLSDEVKRNLSQWRFRRDSPGAQKNEVIVTYTFRLSGECEDSRLCKETEFWYEYPYHAVAIADHYPLRY